MATQVFDAVLEFALLGLFAGVSGYAVHLVVTTVRGQPETPAPREEAPGHD